MSRRWRGAVRGARLCRASILVTAMLFAGCTWQSPRTVAQNYLTALEQRQYEQCYLMLTEVDREAYPRERFLTAVPLTQDVTRRWFWPVLKATDFDLGEPQGQGLRRIVPVKVKAPDLARLERTINAMIGLDADPVPAARHALSSGDFPALSYLDDIVLVKEHHRWRVRADFPARERAADLRRHALDSYYGGSYAQAVGYYRDAITALDRSEATGGWGLKYLYGRELHEIETIVAQRAVALAYDDKLKLSDIGMRMSAAGRPAIFGKIANNGDRPVDSVRMNVTFYQGHGADRRDVFVEQHVPIATPLQFSDFSLRALPLMPGETRNFGFELKAPIDTQRSADPYVTVSDVVLTQPDLMPSTESGARTKGASPTARATAGDNED